MEMGIYGSYLYDNTYNTFTPYNGSVVRVLLNTALNPLGYDITSIASLTGTGQGRSGQKYDLAYSLVGDQSFVTVAGDQGATVNRHAGAYGEVQVVISSGIQGLQIASHVDALQFTFYDVPTTYPESMYREIDVLGISSSVPESSTLLLLGSGLGGLILFRKRFAHT